MAPQPLDDQTHRLLHTLPRPIVVEPTGRVVNDRDDSTVLPH